MALASVTCANASLDGIRGGTPANQIPFASLHTATTGTTGAAEYAGVTRLAATWNAAASSAMTNSSAWSFTTSGASAVTHLGTWSLVTAGVFGIGMPLGSTVTAATITVAAGAASLTSA